MNKSQWLGIWLVAGLIGSAAAKVDDFAAEDAVWLTTPGNDVAAAARKRSCPPAAPGGKTPVDIGDRLELFIDDFLIDGLSGGAERRLHHPVPREVVMEFGAQARPWDILIGYPTIVRDGDRFLLYYRGMFVNDQYRREQGVETGSAEESIQMLIKSSRARDQVVCVLESHDGINFTRPELGLFDLSDRLAGVTTNNNVVWAEGHPTHNFTPFLDTNPAAAPEARFKAIARRPTWVKGGTLCGYKSPDGLRWEVMDRNGGFAGHPTDSQNLGFWDAARGYYVCYMRAWGGYPDKRSENVRCIRRATSPDFINWSETENLQYNDDRQEHLYTNGIHPYERAPHILIGLPNRFWPDRVVNHDYGRSGVNDIVLMSSRDGRLFDRWNESFVRPEIGHDFWTDRGYYPTANMVRTSPGELSFYWIEFNWLPSMRLRRGTLRVDGFVSVRAGEKPGELITRPLIFSGDRLVVNFATSAAGALWFALCDEAGRPLPGFGFADSRELYGSEIEHVVAWQGGSDLAALRGRPVRLRVRLDDADLYSIRFAGARSEDYDNEVYVPADAGSHRGKVRIRVDG